MTLSEYLSESAHTEYTPEFIRLSETNGPEELRTARLMHAAIGIVTEAGEFIDALKKLTIYGKPLDRTNLVEEIGDVMWYVALACRALDVPLEEALDRNIAKLMRRFPGKFTSENALNRNLDAERAALEGK